MHVFLVEDSPMLRAVLRAHIEHMGGIVVGEAAGEAAAVSGIKALRPDIAIVDLGLEDGHGLDVIRAAKRVRPELVVFVLTSQKYATIEALCKKCGADFVFEKSERHFARFAAILPLVMATRCVGAQA
jgi:DNA-binding NarL/FixJ family response regulator